MPNIWNSLQSLIMRGYQKLACNDLDPNQQQAQVEFFNQAQNVKVITPYGFYSSAPVGSEWIIFSLRGNANDRAGIANDYVNRPKDLKEGDVYLVNVKTGDYINILTNGSINVKSSQAVNVNAPTSTITGNVNITGDVNLAGKLTATGEVEAIGIKLSTHTHGGVTAGPSNTGSPNP